MQILNFLMVAKLCSYPKVQKDKSSPDLDFQYEYKVGHCDLSDLFQF